MSHFPHPIDARRARDRKRDFVWHTRWFSYTHSLLLLSVVQSKLHFWYGARNMECLMSAFHILSSTPHTLLSRWKFSWISAIGAWLSPSPAAVPAPWLAPPSSHFRVILMDHRRPSLQSQLLQKSPGGLRSSSRLSSSSILHYSRVRIKQSRIFFFSFFVFFIIVIASRVAYWLLGKVPDWLCFAKTKKKKKSESVVVVDDLVLFCFPISQSPHNMESYSSTISLSLSVCVMRASSLNKSIHFFPLSSSDLFYDDLLPPPRDPRADRKILFHFYCARFRLLSFLFFYCDARTRFCCLAKVDFALVNRSTSKKKKWHRSISVTSFLPFSNSIKRRRRRRRRYRL